MRNALVVCLLTLATFVNAADKPCSKADSAAAQKAIDMVVTWQQLHKAWQDYGHCDADPAVADIFTDALLRLAVAWTGVKQLAADMKDAQYRDFVYKHLKSDAAKDDRESVYSRAKKDCPSGQDTWCDEMAGTISAALEADDAKAAAQKGAAKK